MGRILCIDFGKKRCGIAVTDSIQLTVNPLLTIDRTQLWSWLKDYFLNEQVSDIVLGHSIDEDGQENELMHAVHALLKALHKSYPQITCHLEDESFSSREALELMIKWGVKKKDRREKANLDKFAAAIILERFLQRK